MLKRSELMVAFSMKWRFMPPFSHTFEACVGEGGAPDRLGLTRAPLPATYADLQVHQGDRLQQGREREDWELLTAARCPSVLVESDLEVIEALM